MTAIRLTVACCIALCSTAAIAAELARPNILFHPNILYILTDDMGYADAGFMGATDVQTPQLDVLAKEGLVLTRHYAMHICSPTRAALLTGRHPIRYGLQQSVYHPSSGHGLPLDEILLPQTLKKAGYRTYAFGKWHLGVEDGHKPHQRGFDYFYGLLGGSFDYNTHLFREEIDWWRNDEQIDEPGYSTTLLGKDAARIIRNDAGTAPLFLYLAFNAPHSPYQAPPAAIAKAESENRKLTKRETFASMIEEVDRSVGVVIDALRETRLLDNTIIVFSSDNGGSHSNAHSSNAPLRDGKWWLYEGGVRVPTFVRWPGHVPAGERSDAIVSATDWYPTFAKLVGQPMRQDAPVDGRDILSTLTGEAVSPHADELLLSITNTQKSVLSGKWKLVLNGPHEQLINHKKLKAGRTHHDTAIEPVELYDLSKDESEKRNVASEHPEIVKRLESMILEKQPQMVMPIREQTRKKKRGK